MNPKQPIKAIIFDLDNTLLRSSINFQQMKQEIHEYLVTQSLCSKELPLHVHTTSTIIALAKESGQYTVDVDRQVWEIASFHEQKGMIGAELEPGVIELLQILENRVMLTVLTNNSLAAAEKALCETGIRSYFNRIAGREQMTSLKPSPSGFHYLLSAYPDLSVDQWLTVGDSWIDAKAAQHAGVAFVAYRAISSEMESRGIQPLGYLERIGELIDYV
ncbi:Pyrimidine 5'-nucleotidase YjjG [compost metagenome]